MADDLRDWIEPGITGFAIRSHVGEQEVRLFKGLVHTIGRLAHARVGEFVPADKVRKYGSMTLTASDQTPPSLAMPAMLLLHRDLPLCAAVEPAEWPPWKHLDFSGYASLFPAPLRLMPVSVLSRKLDVEEIAPLVSDRDLYQVRYWKRTSRSYLPVETIGDVVFNYWD